ncbi:hypothetical protein AX14_001808 [Amanita brunnescens Koide BX004]|nr:hypothetical protein AX14_001808 [Amanita brunnescens Koide BX004]
MAFAIAEIWHYLIDSFGNYPALGVITWTYRVQIALMVIIILSVQSLYTLRVWKLSRDKNRLWPWILFINIMGAYVAGITITVETCKISLFTEIDQIRWSILLSFSMATFNDIMLAVGMCHILYLGTTVFAETKSMLGMIVRYVIVSGALTSMCSITGLITFVAMPDNFVFLGVALVFSKLYINSYLAMMNARKNIRNTATNVVQMSDIEARFRNMDFQGCTSTEIGSRTSGAQDKGLEIRVDVTRQWEEVMLDVRGGGPWE